MSATNINERDRLVRLSTIIAGYKDKDGKTTQEPLLPMCKATWYAGIKDGKYPQGIRLSPRVVMWRLSDVMAIVNRTPNE